MATGWLRGTVKEVPSGDTLVIVGNVKAGPRPEKRITLSSLVAPRQGRRRDGSTPDEPFAWQSREFLRQLCIGQACTFKVDYTLENIPGREFGSVFLGTPPENVALTVVQKGWAKIRPAGGQQSPYYEQLAQATSIAEGGSLGVFGKADASSHRAAPASSKDFDAQALLDEQGKGKPLPAVVELVISGSMLRATLLPDRTSIAVMMCGVQSPSMGRRAPPPGAEAPADGAPSASNGSAAASEKAAPTSAAAAVGATPPASAPEPYAAQSKEFVEMAALNREVRVVLEGVDKSGNLFGTVMYPHGEGVADLGLHLVQAGLAKTVEWGLNMMPGGGHKLREAERAAKQAKAGMWHNWTPPQTATSKLQDNFQGTVREIVSGDCLVVVDSASSGTERRITLSSIRAPRVGRRDEKSEPWAIESREALRSALIGKKVQVSMEYTRKIGGAPGAAGPPSGQERTMAFATVTCDSADPPNVAEMLLARGLAGIVRHRTDEERSAHYEALMEAEQAGKRGKKGMYSGKDAPLHHVNDVSLPGTGSRAKQYLPFLQRGRVAGIVEFVITGHRLKVHVPKEGVTVAFSPSGIRCPSRAATADPVTGRSAAAGEPYAEEAMAFTRSQCLQRDVEIEVETVDRGGTFLGRLRVTSSSLDLGLGLLQAGLAKLHPSFEASRVHGGRQLADAQEAAQEKRLKVWEGYTGEAEQQNGAAHAPDAPQQTETTSVSVTDVTDATLFYFQKTEEKRLAWLEQQLADLGREEASQGVPRLTPGNLCAAQFSLDNQWYRARVAHVKGAGGTSPEFSVQFVDYGNRETVPASRIRPLDAGTAAVPPQAHVAALWGLQVGNLDDDYGEQAARVLSGAVGGGRQLQATILGRDSSEQPPKLQVVLRTASSEASSAPSGSVNAELLKAGVARLKPPKEAKQHAELLQELTEAEEVARKGHVGMWRYGDPGGDDDEDERPVRSAWGRR